MKVLKIDGPRKDKGDFICLPQDGDIGLCL